ncbi:UNVERIFIED_CONTAM: hypothetical protein Sangu_0585500 [Sesamum angustifolium]|uniref:Uncharacterized protein n=1 Tax=Sesamum angustifolium TaxID=2727405 RepID=A0AAW2QAL7_9LAMI
MGSEGPIPAVTIHVTGFKKFHGVAENPTETIVNNLQAYMHKRGLPKGLVLGSCTILETAGHGALVPLYQTLQSAVSQDANAEFWESYLGQLLSLHFSWSDKICYRIKLSMKLHSGAQMRWDGSLRNSQLFQQTVGSHGFERYGY